MNEVFKRMVEIMEKQGLSKSEMAGVLGISPGSISHLFQGRNKPGLDAVRSFSKHYPTIDLHWLLKGEAGSKLESGSAEKADEPAMEKKDEPKEVIFVFPDKSFEIYRPKK